MTASIPLVRVLLGDDHRIVREGLKQVLADAPEVQVVAEAATGPEVVDRVQALAGALDVVLLDIAVAGAAPHPPPPARAHAQHLP